MRKASSPQFATAREAVLALPSRARVLVSQACGAPMSLLQALADERDHFQALELCTGVLFTDYPILPCISENITLTTWQVSAPVQALADQGKLEYLPLRLSQVPKTFSPDGALPVDAVLIQVSTPDRNGYVSMGVTVSTMIDASRQAPLVIAEVNRQAPRTMGNTFLHMSEIDYLVDADYPGVEYRPVSLGDVERTIAQYVTELIPDGATIQSGLGAIPEALLFLLDGKKDLGVHSGMVTDGLLPLIEKGVINNSRKSIDRHKVVIGEVMGSRETIRYVHENPMMHFDSANYTHNPQVIGRIENFVAINSAVEIDLGGTGGCRKHRPEADQRPRRAVRLCRGRVDLPRWVLHLRHAFNSVQGQGVAHRVAAGAWVCGQHPPVSHRLRGHRIRRRVLEREDDASAC